ncbi:hypothetical protein V8D89_001274 [Ganoderma adspersum]
MGDTLAKKTKKGKPFIAASASGKKVAEKAKSATTTKQKKTPAVAANDDDEPDNLNQPLTPERAQQLLEELRVTKAKLAKEEMARKAAEDEAAKVQNENKKRARKVKIIPRPSGTCGRQYHLRDAMRLGDRKDGNAEKTLACKRRYSKILSTVQDIAILGGLKWRKGVRFQDPVALGAVYEIARNEVPFLARFENDWVTAQIISQFFMNRRRHEMKQGRVGKGRINSPKQPTRKRILGKVAPAIENSDGRGSPGAGHQEDAEAGEGKGVTVEDDDQEDEDLEGPGIGGDNSDRHSDSSDSEKDYGDAEDDDEDEDEDEDDKDEEEEEEANEGLSRKKQRLT